MQLPTKSVDFLLLLVENLRFRLRDVSPKAADEFDDWAAMNGFGWLVAGYVVNTHEWLTPVEFSERFPITRYDVTNWAKKFGLERRGERRSYRYNVGDILRAAADMGK
ncbi:hypothetical protein ACXPWS_07605 [Mycobacterium sp. BMJ-28]